MQFFYANRNYENTNAFVFLSVCPDPFCGFTENMSILLRFGTCSNKCNYVSEYLLEWLPNNQKPKLRLEQSFGEF